MYARIGRGRFRTEDSAAIIQIAQESLETYRRAQGFRGVTFLYDRAGGWGFVVSQWATRADAEATVELLRPTTERFAAYAADTAQPVPDVSGPLPLFEIVAQA